MNLDTLTPAEVATWKPGETLLLNGRMLTGRDAAHKRIADLFARGEKLPPGVDFTNRVIYDRLADTSEMPGYDWLVASTHPDPLQASRTVSNSISENTRCIQGSKRYLEPM